MALDPAFRATHPLTSDSPQQSLTLVAVCGCGGCPHLKIMWRSAGYGVDESLQGLLVNMVFLQEKRSFLKVYGFAGSVTAYEVCHWDIFRTKNHKLITFIGTDHVIIKKKNISLTSSSSLNEDLAAIAEAIPAFLAWTSD